VGVENHEKEVIMDQEPINRGLLEENETLDRPEYRETPFMAGISAFRPSITGLALELSDFA